MSSDAPLKGPWLAVFTAAQALAGILLFLAFVTAPLFETLFGGLLGASAVWRLSLAVALLTGYRVWATPRDSRSKWHVFVLLCLFLMALNVFVRDLRPTFSWGPVIGHDQMQYYAYLHSWVFDRDLDFTNEYHILPDAWDIMENMHPERPEHNVAPIGSAVLWLPFYLVAHGAILLMRALGANVTADGISSPYASAAAWGSMFYAAMGLWLVYTTVRRVSSARAAFWTMLLIALASSLTWYATGEVWMSHACSFFAAALVFWLWQRTKDDRSLRGWVLLGAAIGLAMLVRPSHFVLLVFPLFDTVRLGARSRAYGRSAAGFTLALASMLVVFAWQLATWYFRYGSISDVPGSPMEWGRPAILEVLFSARHGLLAWHPVLWLGFLGLPLIWRRSRYLFVCVVAVLILFVYTNAAISSWWGGGSFGMRRFVGALPFLAPGMALAGAWAYQQLARRPAVVIGVVTAFFFAYNWLLVIQYRDHWTDMNDQIPFQTLWANSALILNEEFGNPASYPVNLWFGWKHGVSPARHDVISGTPGIDDLVAEGYPLRLYLGRGWLVDSLDGMIGNGPYNAIERHCTVLLPLFPGTEYEVTLTIIAPPEIEQQQLQLMMNDTDLGTGMLSKHKASVVKILIPADVPYRGVNELHLVFSNLLTKQRPDRTAAQGGDGLEVRIRKPIQVAAQISRMEVHRVLRGE